MHEQRIEQLQRLREACANLVQPAATLAATTDAATINSSRQRYAEAYFGMARTVSLPAPVTDAAMAFFQKAHKLQQNTLVPSVADDQLTPAANELTFTCKKAIEDAEADDVQKSKAEGRTR
jgi:hypothetical protein